VRIEVAHDVGEMEKMDFFPLPGNNGGDH
jgi:hypothetical protein